MFRVGVQGGAGGNQSKKDQASGLPGGDTRHWRFIQFGSENNAANPFMTRAAEKSAQAATDKFISTFGPAIDRALKKAGG
jgi:HK97 gp10 family phage protein